MEPAKYHALSEEDINLLTPTGHVMHQQFNTLRAGDADLRF